MKDVKSKKISLRNLRNSKLQLSDELVIYIEYEGDLVTAISYDLGQYGQGVSEEDAIQDLCEVISEYYFLLTSEKKKLSRNLQGHLSYLRRIIKEV